MQFSVTFTFDSRYDAEAVMRVAVALADDEAFVLASDGRIDAGTMFLSGQSSHEAGALVDATIVALGAAALRGQRSDY